MKLSQEWDSLPEDEKKAVYGAYRAINETPGVTSGLQMQPPETATTVRVQDGKTLTTDGPFVEIKEAIGGYLFFEAQCRHVHPRSIRCEAQDWRSDSPHGRRLRAPLGGLFAELELRFLAA
jgi:hypothetical protein